LNCLFIHQSIDYSLESWLVFKSSVYVTAGDKHSSPAEQWCEDVCFLAFCIGTERWQSRVYSTVF